MLSVVFSGVVYERKECIVIHDRTYPLLFSSISTIWIFILQDWMKTVEIMNTVP